MAVRGGPPQQPVDAWGWPAPNDGMQYILELNSHRSREWKCVRCRVWVTEGHLHSQRHKDWVNYFQELHRGANPWMATTVAAVDAGRQLVADIGAPPPPPPPAGAAAAAAASAPAAAAAASTPAAAGAAAASTGDQLQEQAQTIMMETMDEMRKMKECMQELKAMVEAQKKSIDDLHSTLGWYTEWFEWWGYEPPKFDR